MLGLSLSFCVKDVLNGKVELSQVEKITTGTACPTRESLIKMCTESYCESYWSKDPEKGLAIALELWDSGRIYQPRLDYKPVPNISRGHWLKC